MSHIDYRHAFSHARTRALKLGVCTRGFVKDLKIFYEMLVSWDGGGEVI